MRITERLQTGPVDFQVPGAKILVVDDDPAVVQSLADALEAEGYHVYRAGASSEAESIIDEVRPDLIILDIMLPDLDGLVFCAQIRSRWRIPVILLSGTRRKSDSILGLKLGADDFIPKPFDLVELKARVEAVLRRSAPSTAQSAEREVYRVNDLVIDLVRHSASIGSTQLALTPTEFRLLATLASRPDEVFTRDALAQQVWGYQDLGHSRVVDVHIRRLRQKLEAANCPPCLVTVRGFGYKLAREQGPLSARTALEERVRRPA